MRYAKHYQQYKDVWQADKFDRTRTPVATCRLHFEAPAKAEPTWGGCKLKLST